MGHRSERWIIKLSGGNWRWSRSRKRLDSRLEIGSVSLESWSFCSLPSGLQLRRNDVFELATVGEYYFFNQPDVGRTGRYLLDFKAYFYGGVALFYNNPKAKYQGEWVALQPLKTEGQTDPYSKIQVALPVGFGMFYTFSRLHRFGWSIGWRYTFTDYIDDIGGYYPDPADLESDLARGLSNRSQDVANNPVSADLVQYFTKGGVRGNPDANDTYLMTSFNYSYVIRGNTKSFGKRKNYLYGRKRGRAGRAIF
jgi:hypothetical protein